MTRKRVSETKAEKLPKKKGRDSAEGESDAPARSSRSSAPGRPARKSATTTTRQNHPPADSTMVLAASDPVDSISVIPKPPAGLTDTVDDATAVVVGSKPSTAAKSSDNTVTAAVTSTTTSAPSTTPAAIPTKEITPWYYSTVFFIAFLLLLSNVLTLGLWMQYQLEVNLEAREISLIAKEEAVGSLQSDLVAKQELLDNLQSQLDKANKDSKHWHRESVRLTTGERSFGRRLEEVERERDEWKSRVGQGISEKSALKKSVNELQSRLGETMAKTAVVERERDSATIQVETLLEEMQQTNIIVEKLEAEGNELRDEVTKLIKQKRKLREECGIQ